MATNAKLTAALHGRKIDSVRQREDELDIDFEDGSTLSLKLASEKGSVTLKDDDDNVKYSE